MRPESSDPLRTECARRYFEPSSTAGVRHQSIQEPPAAALKFFRQGRNGPPRL